GVRRVVTAWREPDTFVTAADGAGVLSAAGVRAQPRSAGKPPTASTPSATSRHRSSGERTSPG
ncbi:hypothetical protein ABZ760_37590, partial [Streptomyces sp. NPDC006658]